MLNLIPIDFEFRGTAERKYDLICCSMEVDGVIEEYWLFQNEIEKIRLKERIKELRDTHTFLAWNVLAEGQSFISLNIDPTKCEWVDLQIEWKMLTNQYHKFMYGKQYIDGKVITTRPPTYGSESGVSNQKAKTNLAAGIYKLTGEIVDTEHKDKMRDICIHGSSDEVIYNKKDIMNYCSSDIKHLTKGYERVKEEIVAYFTNRVDKGDLKPTLEHILYRGETAARCALMQSIGYPLDMKATRKFSDSTKGILKDLSADINDNLDVDVFRWKKSEDRYSMYQAPIKEWIKNSEYESKWLRTDPTKTKPDGDYSLSLDAFEKHFSYSHDYPRGFLPAQIIRYLKTRRSLNGFLPKSANAKDKTNIFDSIGFDGRCRPYLNPYGSQTARFQPKATSFIPLKAAWMRSLIMPRTGRSIASIDYGSEEFLISAYESGDKDMIEAYRSGDVYLHFAKLAGAVPMDAKKEDHKEIRNLFKATTLGISYSMGPVSLAAKLTADTGRKVSVQEAKDLIKKFADAFPRYARYVDTVRYTYHKKGYWMLDDGWIMFGDNDNKRSVSNMPIQGMGSCILRKAIQLCQDAGLTVIYPLHDALYIEYDSFDFNTLDMFAECMRKAFAFYFDDSENAYKDIRLDCDTWGPDYEDKYIKTSNGMDVKMQNIYIDERSISEYKRFKKYM